jgi:cyanophycinase
MKRMLALAIVGGLAVAAGLGLKLALWSRAARAAAESFGPQPGGTLLICGGGGLPDDIRERFCQRAGGADARIVIIPAHHVEPGSDSERRYLAAWAPFEIGSVEVLSIERRKLADDPNFVAPLKRATGVWLAGGDQNWLTMIYRDTETSRQLEAVLDRGGVIGGSSAGAAAIPSVMIASGTSEAVESEGLGLWPDAVIDQHFLRRNRVQRFVKTLAAHPELIGFGVDEQTALEVELRRGRLEVLGRSYVLACVPAGGQRPERLEVLKHGDRTSLEALRDYDAPILSPLDLDELAAAQ